MSRTFPILNIILFSAIFSCFAVCLYLYYPPPSLGNPETRATMYLSLDYAAKIFYYLGRTKSAGLHVSNLIHKDSQSNQSVRSWCIKLSAFICHVISVLHEGLHWGTHDHFLQHQGFFVSRYRRAGTGARSRFVSTCLSQHTSCFRCTFQ